MQIVEAFGYSQCTCRTSVHHAYPNVTTSPLDAIVSSIGLYCKFVHNENVFVPQVQSFKLSCFPKVPRQKVQLNLKTVHDIKFNCFTGTGLTETQRCNIVFARRAIRTIQH